MKMKKTDQPRGVIAALLLAMAWVPLLAGCSGTQRISDERRQAHVESFDKVWETIRDTHWDPDLNGVDWDAAREKHRPDVENAKSDGQARRAMAALIEELGQSHFVIIPAEAYDRFNVSDEDSGESSVPGWAGVGVRVRGDEAIVVWVWPGSPAEDAGVKPGWLVERVDDVEVAEVISAVNEIELTGPMRPETMLTVRAGQLFDGDAGEEIETVFLDGEDQEVTKAITLGEMPGKPIRLIKLPGIKIRHRTETLDSGVGYFSLNMFFNAQEVMKDFGDWVKDHAEAPGLVIDMRGNHGGFGLMSMGMAGWLVDDKGHELGVMTQRESTLRWVVNPRKNAYKGPVAVLTDEVSISNAEILADGLRSIGRARVFGERTAGQVLPATVDELPNGDRFLYAFADYTGSDGHRLEGDGVVPDEEIPVSREALLEGGDAVLDRAEAWILEQNWHPGEE